MPGSGPLLDGPPARSLPIIDYCEGNEPRLSTGGDGFRLYSAIVVWLGPVKK